MPTNPKQEDNSPRADDGVLGGEAPPLVGGVVLGGIEGVKRRLAVTTAVGQRLAALSDALNYGEAGLELVLKALQDESPKVQLAAYFLLKDSDSSKVKKQLSNYLPCFSFDVVTVDAQGVINSRSKKQAQFFPEDLGNGVTLEMVAIPGGTFIMGSPEREVRHTKDESPQHQVTVKSFFMGKYPVTQAQWQAVAALPQVKTKLDSEPSNFKGEDRPVEEVSWHSAVEFCDRLSQKTGRQYRLASEAEWEYACRAGTTTPFHFGETITADLANYCGEHTYGSESKGVFRWETTPVGHFQVANAFGLYDMHGNVWDWCADSWHDNYQGAPTDGSVWRGDKKNHFRILRGGAWHNYPFHCRSAYRRSLIPANWHSSYIGFRVVCEAA